jgi:hypothetical protein
MTTTEKNTDVKKKIWALGLLVAAFLLAVLSALPAAQQRLRNYFQNDERQVLAKITAYYGVQQNQYTILKVRDSLGIKVEIYSVALADSQQVFKQSFDLNKDSDAFITLDKSSTNLALSDLDSDGQLDILAPSVDQNGNLRLNAFRYSPELSLFQAMAENQLKQ